MTLFFVGDVMQHAPQITAALGTQQFKTYNYLPCFQYIQPYWEKADYVLANLETTLSDRNFSGYPQFCAPWQLASDIKQRRSRDILTTNNNHSCDKGENGIRKTIYYLDSLEIPHIGTYTDTYHVLPPHVNCGLNIFQAVPPGRAEPRAQQRPGL
ncbi:MAG: CapA family protein [Odoribacter sp.]